MTIVFSVRDPIGVNRMYGKSKTSKRLFLTPHGREFKHRVVASAAVARANCEWPADPFRVGSARLSYQLWNYRGDTDGPAKALRDCLEGVLYVNDRQVEDGPHPFALHDGGGRRVVVTVELLELRSPHAAQIECDKHRQRVLKNALKRAQRRTAATRKPASAA